MDLYSNIVPKNDPTWKITYEEYLMGRQKLIRLTEAELVNARKLLNALNLLRHVWGKPMRVTSGWRPHPHNKAAGGAKQSAHLTCEACDFADPDGELAKFCLDNLEILEQFGLYLESPEFTKGWIHLQTRRPKSGNRIFNP